MTVTYLECPFCGWRAGPADYEIVLEENEDDDWHVHCHKCGYDQTEESYDDLWINAIENGSQQESVGTDSDFAGGSE